MIKSVRYCGHKVIEVGKSIQVRKNEYYDITKIDMGPDGDIFIFGKSYNKETDIFDGPEVQIYFVPSHSIDYITYV